ncbi:ribose-5-phosphate isomerase [Thermosyntropha lipolytica DSM 11003]|uniref:Ribose-5-phosphate isomerase n=1 Tax=Thermosyntropha lipolytica DSM 11003 TaxID=1123382 RepID=A0A1M5NVS6_9FIRM|nr:ribose 5-phosphate isomerase B [Thermosyntropha lipolytica]SHG93289.1 ribose-5-phosphate isomerase [Thermosyntropha lipolytica DSM 11003]
MKVAIGNDHAGVMLKEEITHFLKGQGYEVINCGTDTLESVDYPDIAEKVAREVLTKGIPGILICGTGIGISIAANKIPGIRAALCNDLFTARMTRKHNDANILALGARVIGPGLAIEIVREFLNTEFEGGRHKARVEKITLIEKKYREQV